MHDPGPVLLIYHNGCDLYRSLVAKCLLKRVTYRALDIRNKNAGGVRENLSTLNQFHSRTSSRVPVAFIGETSDPTFLGTYERTAEFLDGLDAPAGPTGMRSA